MGVKVTGDRQLRKSLATIGTDVNMAGRAALRRGIEQIRQRAEDLAPVEFGNLERAIQTQEKHVGTNAWEQTVYVNPNVRATGRRSNGETPRVGKYAKYVEDGVPSGIGKSQTSREKARRLGTPVGPGFMRRAFNRLQPQIRRDVEAAIQAALEQRTAALAAKQAQEQANAKAKATVQKNIQLAKTVRAKKAASKAAKPRTTRSSNKRRGR